MLAPSLCTCAHRMTKGTFWGMKRGQLIPKPIRPVSRSDLLEIISSSIGKECQVDWRWRKSKGRDSMNGWIKAVNGTDYQRWFCRCAVSLLSSNDTSNDNVTPNADYFYRDVAQKRPVNGSISQVICRECRMHVQFWWCMHGVCNISAMGLLSLYLQLLHCAPCTHHSDTCIVPDWLACWWLHRVVMWQAVCKNPQKYLLMLDKCVTKHKCRQWCLWNYMSCGNNNPTQAGYWSDFNFKNYTHAYLFILTRKNKLRT